MSDFNPRPDPEILDLAYVDAEELVESYLALWRSMSVKGSPAELLHHSGDTNAEDEMFFRGGCVALEVLLGEVTAKRDSIFLES